MRLTFEQARALLNSASTIAISTHLMPDGDGLGAEIALSHYLENLDKAVIIINPDACPQRYKFLDLKNKMRVWNAAQPSSEQQLPQALDVAVIVDTHEASRIGPVFGYFKQVAKKILVLDHHPVLNWPALDLSQVDYVVDEQSSSIGELLYRLFMSDSNSAAHLTKEVALGLYVSIMTDTNSFRYSRTTALSHRIAADLIEFGIQPEEIYQAIYSTKSIEHLKLIGEVLAGVQEVNTDHGSYAWVEITRPLRQKFSATSDDTQTIVNFLLMIKSAAVLGLLREEDDGRIKVSLKSKGVCPVSGIAKEFGGGGHEFASGFTSTLSLEDIRKKLSTRIVLELNKLGG
jgi:phosphoesterase RecJ-like protein